MPESSRSSDEPGGRGKEDLRKFRHTGSAFLVREGPACALLEGMAEKTARGGRVERVRQFSVFTANRLGRLHDLIALLSSREVHVLALTVLDTTDSAIIRLVVDDPDAARELLVEQGFAFTESDLVVVEVDSATELGRLMAASLEAELNINYLYSFITHPQGKSMLALSIEDNEVAEQVLRKHQFRVLKQSDISR